VRVQHQYPGDDGKDGVTEQVYVMRHFLTVAFDHSLQLFDFFGGRLALQVTVEAVGDRQHTENEIDTDIHDATMLTELAAKQYRRFDLAAGITRAGTFLATAIRLRRS
jgi:hypothetical protein